MQIIVKTICHLIYLNIPFLNLYKIQTNAMMSQFFIASILLCQGWLKVHYNVWNHTFKYEKKWPLGMHLWDSKRAGIHIRDFLSLWMMYFFMTIPWRKVLKIGYKHLLKTRLDHWSTVIIVLLRCVHPADPGSKVMIKSNI